MKNNIKTIVITRSTRGIGFGLALNFLKSGHQVVINGLSNNSLREALDKLHPYKEQVIGFMGNVNTENFSLELYNFTIKNFNKVDIWINNAGIAKPMNKIWDFSFKDIQTNIDINITAPTNAMRTVIPLMEEQGFGIILNMEGLETDSNKISKLLTYGTGRRGIHYISKSVSKALKGSKVKVGIISLGIVLTRFILDPVEGANEKDNKATKYIVSILGDKIETITPVLVNKILKINTQYPKIEYLSKWKYLFKFIKAAFVKTIVVPEV